MSEVMGEVVIYKQGLLTASVCAPASYSVEQVEAALPPATDELRWCKSDDPTFAGGQPNPCECNKDATRRHWLMEC